MSLHKCFTCSFILVSGYILHYVLVCCIVSSLVSPVSILLSPSTSHSPSTTHSQTNKCKRDVMGNSFTPSSWLIRIPKIPYSNHLQWNTSTSFSVTHASPSPVQTTTFSIFAKPEATNSHLHQTRSRTEFPLTKPNRVPFHQAEPSVFPPSRTECLFTKPYRVCLSPTLTKCPFTKPN